MTGTDRTGSPDSSLGAVMSRIARELQQEHGDVGATLQAIATTAVDAVPGAQHCGISLVLERSRVRPRASSSRLPVVVDALQERLGQGPCMDAVWDQEAVRVDDVATDGRWPAFAAVAAEAGVGSMLCFRLYVSGDELGAMHLYSAAPRAFDDQSVDHGRLLAGHAAVALAGAQHEHHLRSAIDHRDLIGQAKGILMERYKTTADQAFAMLVRSSSLTNRRLWDVAEELSTTGSLPRREG